LKTHQDKADICAKVCDCLRKLAADDSIKAKIVDKDDSHIILETLKNHWQIGVTSLSCLE